LPDTVKTLLAELESISWSKQQPPSVEAAEKLTKLLQLLQNLGSSHLTAYDHRRVLGSFLLVAGVGACLPAERFLFGGVLAAMSGQLGSWRPEEGVSLLADVGPKGLEALTYLARNIDLPKLQAITRR